MGANRTLKADRELAIKLAKGLGHEMGAWRWWFGKRRAICSCELCWDWIGLNAERDWEYNPEWHHGASIKGTAIVDSFEWRKTKCRGVIKRGRERASWTKNLNRLLSIIKKNTPKKAAEIICGNRP